MRGHYLGRVIYEGSAQPNTDIPGFIGGFAGERVLRAPADGIFIGTRQIGEGVRAGEIVGYVDNIPMTATIDGVLRGLLADGVAARVGMKSGDVDPRETLTTVAPLGQSVGCWRRRAGSAPASAN